MATTQTIATLTVENKTFYEKVLLKRLLPTLTFAKYGQKKPAPKKEGDTVNFRRYGALAVNTTALTEGVTPAGKSMGITTVTATVAQYGDFIEMSDVLDLVGIDPNLTEAAELLGEQAGLSLDTIIRDKIVIGTNVQYAGGKLSRITVANTDILTALEIRKAVRTLRNSNVSPLENGYYIGIIGPDTEFDLQGDADWKDVGKYQDKEKIYDGEIGKLYGVKFVRTTNEKVFEDAGASAIDVHTTLILGKDSFGIVDIAGSSSPQMIVKPLGSSGSADPLDQRQTSAWKAMLTAVILQQLAILRIEHAASI